MKIDSELVRELADLLTETGLTEIEVDDGDRKIRVSRGGGVAAAAPGMRSPPSRASGPPVLRPPPFWP